MAETTSTAPPSITIDELADRWGMTRRTLQRYRQEGKPMPKQAAFLGSKPIRFLLAEVERFEKENGMS